MSAEPSIVIEHCIADDVKVSKKRSIDAISIETDTTKRQKYNSANDTKRADDNDGESATPSSASAGASTSASAGASTGRTKVGQRWATNDAYELGRKNALPADKDIKMDEPPHKYYMRGSSRFMTSVTTIIGKYHPPFERDAIADKLAKTKKYRAMGMDADAIKASWKRAADLGTMLHAAIEQFYNGETPDLSHEGPAEKVDVEVAAVKRIALGAGLLEAPGGITERWLVHRNHVPSWDELIEKGLVVDTIEISSAWTEICQVYEDAVAALKKVPGNFIASAHSSHAYRSGINLYFTFVAQPEDATDMSEVYMQSWNAVLKATAKNGGGIAHHHGIGRVRKDHLVHDLGDAGLSVLEKIKTSLDPQGIMNPGVLIPDA